MSLSATDNNGPYSRVSSGKTPPPAPSAAYAKRARELASDDRLRYRPPALRALASGSPTNEVPTLVTTPSDGSSGLPPTNYPPGFRRARAGTLPSNVQLAAQRYAASNPLGTGSPSTESFVDQQIRQSPTPNANTASSNQLAANSLAGLSRPTLRHSTSVASSVATSAVTERNSRLRSGSLTLPSGGLSNAFGPSIFSSSWLTSANGNNGFGTLDELRSVTSAESQDDFDVHTLDYLGLDDSHRHPPAATLSELRNQAQAAIAGNLANPASRLRASTVSNPYRTRGAPSLNAILSPTNDEDEEYFDNYNDDGYGNQGRSAYDLQGNYDANQYVAKGFRSIDHLSPHGLGNRPRAISVGTLDDPMRTIQRRATVSQQPNSMAYLNDMSPSNSTASLLGNNLNSQLTPQAVTPMRQEPQQPEKVPAPRLSNVGNSAASTALRFQQNGEAPNQRQSPYLMAPSGPHRSVSPKAEQQTSSQTQTPTRSLWIGNLDSAVTSEQLIHVFAPYGAIESLRLLPEKECGFVNFVDQADAIRAKEDVLNRLGGNIGMPNGQTVRIGFGKADSAPVAPAKNTPAAGSGTTTPSAGKTAAGGPPGSGMDAQLQSSPTRALWIGSIPSTTTPAAILSVFSPYGPIESARVLTHKNCGFINFERLDDAVRARKALNGRDVLGSDVGAIRIGFAKVPVKGSQEGGEDAANVAHPIGDLTVAATIQTLRGIKGASTIPTEQQVVGGGIENYRSHLLIDLIASGQHTGPAAGLLPAVTEQQMVMTELSGGALDAEPDIAALADFRPPTMYYTTIPLVSERANNRRWDAAKLRELRKRLDSGSMSVEEIDQVSEDFLDAEIVDLASDWLGNTVVQKLFERCNPAPRFRMLERLAPHLAMIGIHKNGTWAAQKIIECVQTPEEVAFIAQNLRPYAPPLLLDQFGNYVIQCCLRFGGPANDFIFDAMVDRMWEVAQGRFGARSMRACLESSYITINQQRRVATAVILNSIPLATNPNGALLLTWLLDTSGFPSRYNLLAPRFTPHLSHLCTHKLASLTVLRIINQKIEPQASSQIVEVLFNSPGDHVLNDVLGDQVNGVSVVHKVLTSAFVDPMHKQRYIEATKRVLIELKVTATQAYRRLIEEVGLPIPNYPAAYPNNAPPGKTRGSQQNTPAVPGLPSGYPTNDQGLAAIMASLQMGGQNAQAGPPQMHVDPSYAPHGLRPPTGYAPPADPYHQYPGRHQDDNQRQGGRRGGNGPSMGSPAPLPPPVPYGSHSPQPQFNQPGMLGMGQHSYQPMPPQPHMYGQPQPYMYQAYPQNPQNMGGTYHT